jgi:hypothetical protein
LADADPVLDGCIIPLCWISYWISHRIKRLR